MIAQMEKPQTPQGKDIVPSPKLRYVPLDKSSTKIKLVALIVRISQDLMMIKPSARQKFASLNSKSSSKVAGA